jgi:hypothetical protein
MSFSIIAASQDDWVPTQIYQALTLDNRSYLGIGAHEHSRLAELSRGRPGVSATLTTAALIASLPAVLRSGIADGPAAARCPSHDLPGIGRDRRRDRRIIEAFLPPKPAGALIDVLKAFHTPI